MEYELKRIHEASIRILWETGFNVHRQEIVKVLRKNGVKVEGSIAFFTEDQIMSSIAQAPKSFTLYARNPKHNMLINRENIWFAAGYGCTSIIDRDGSRRSADYADYIKFAKLVHQSDTFSINGGILVQPSDLQPEIGMPMMMLAAMIHSDKCLMGIPGLEKKVDLCMNMAAVLYGGDEAFREKPHLLTLINTASPLHLGNIGADTLVACARYRQPVIIAPGPMAGATGPVTIAGNLAVGNAEALAAIAAAQMLCPGIPVIYGLNPTTMNMRSGAVSIGSPLNALQMVYSARLAKAYNLPNRCGGTLTDAKFVGAQSGYESMMSMMSTLAEKTSFVLHSAGILDSYASMSFEKFISDLEVISMAKRFMGRLDVTDTAIPVDEISRIGIGGEYLTSEHTYENCRKTAWHSQVGINKVLENNQDSLSLYELNIQKQMEEMLEAYKRPKLDEELLLELRRYLEVELGIGKELLKKKQALFT